MYFKTKMMKRTILTTILSIIALVVFAAGEAEIKFDKTSHDFGSFPESQKAFSRELPPERSVGTAG